MVSTPKTASHNFDPTNFNDPDLNQKNGNYEPTDYQAALVVRNWMHANISGGMITGKHFDEAKKNGTITYDGKTFQLTEPQRAGFLKFAANDLGLFNRLDAGENGTHDYLIGEWDIDAAIKNGRLHGSAEQSKEGHWRNRSEDMVPADAAKLLDKFFKDKFGEDWTSVTQDEIRRIANTEHFRDPKKNGKTTPIDDPEVIRAAGLLYENWGELQEGEGNSVGTLSRKELEKLMLL